MDTLPPVNQFEHHSPTTRKQLPCDHWRQQNAMCSIHPEYLLMGKYTKKQQTLSLWEISVILATKWHTNNLQKIKEGTIIE